MIINDTKEEYIILKNGKRLETFRPDTLELTIAVIQHLEAMMDRNIQHSPYTIGKINLTQ
jgi:hypothetical protein